jgi:hypothetical protein
MAEVNFYIQYFVNADGKEWADLSEEFTESLLKECSDNMTLNFNDTKFEPSLVDLSEIDTWSEIPKVFKDQGFDDGIGKYWFLVNAASEESDCYLATKSVLNWN